MSHILKWLLFIWAALLFVTIIHEGAHYAACRFCSIVPKKVIIGEYPGMGGISVQTPTTFYYVSWLPFSGATYFDGRAYMALSPWKRIMIDAAGLVTHLLALLILPFLAIGGRSSPWRMIAGLPFKVLVSFRSILSFAFALFYMPPLDPKPEHARWSYKDFLMFLSAWLLYSNFFPAGSGTDANDGYSIMENLALAIGIAPSALLLGYTVLLAAFLLIVIASIRRAAQELIVHCMVQEVERAQRLMHLQELYARLGRPAPPSPPNPSPTPPQNS